jgi:hypothetical protein
MSKCWAKTSPIQNSGFGKNQNNVAIIGADEKIVLNISLLWMISLLWARWMIYRGFMEAVLQFVEPKRRDNRGSLFSFFFNRVGGDFWPRICPTRARTHPGALASPAHRISPGSQFRRDDNVYIHVMAVLLFLSGQNRAYSNYA